jgi:hypothetical protein
MNEQSFLKALGLAVRYAGRIVVCARGPGPLPEPEWLQSSSLDGSHGGRWSSASPRSELARSPLAFGSDTGPFPSPRARSTIRPASLSRPVYFGLLVLLVGLGVGSAGCAGVRPEQRAILADPTMVPRAEPLEAEAREHVFDNREGAFGGGSVQGGGCGCN